ncbi:MAG: MarR family transcriptional regulator [Bacillota bacterium]|nr:MarR family transcriptional regulator [Bacillota bacterium]
MDTDLLIKDIFAMVGALRDKFNIDNDIIVSEIPSSYYTILDIIDHAPQIAITELADYLNISQPNCSRSVNKLAARGFLIKTPALEDKRIQTLALTDKGKQIISSNERLLHQQILEKALEYDEDTLKELKKAVDKVLEITNNL